jgi:hypothetical protein
LIYYNKGRVGIPVNWLLSAVGRAYLAHCPENERDKVVALLRKSALPENWLARDPKRRYEILSETRRKAMAHAIRPSLAVLMVSNCPTDWPASLSRFWAAAGSMV